MADVRLTPEWCEWEADVCEKEGMEKTERALRLAALALRRHEALEALVACRCQELLCEHRAAAATAKDALDTYCHGLTRPSAAEEER